MVAEHFDLKYREDLTELEVKWIKQELFCAEEEKNIRWISKARIQ